MKTQSNFNSYYSSSSRNIQVLDTFALITITSNIDLSLQDLKYPYFRSSSSAFTNIFYRFYLSLLLKLESTYLATISGSRLKGRSIPNWSLRNYFPPTAAIIEAIPLCPLD